VFHTTHPKKDIVESGRVCGSVTRKKETVKILRLFLLEEAGSRRHAGRRKIIKEVEKRDKGLVDTQTWGFRCNIPVA